MGASKSSCGTLDVDALNRMLARAYPNVTSPQDRRRKLGVDLRKYFECLVRICEEIADDIESGRGKVPLPTAPAVFEAFDKLSYSDKAVELASRELFARGTDSEPRFTVERRRQFAALHRQLAQYIRAKFLENNTRFNTQLACELLTGSGE